jgi:ribosomal protein L11 methyltransferase
VSDADFLTVRLEIDEPRVASLEAALTSIGAIAIELADAGDEAILEPAPGTTPLWKRVSITALFEPPANEMQIRLAVASVAAPGALPRLKFGAVANRDWVTRLRDQLEPLQFGTRLWVCPPGKPCRDPDGVAVTLEPGLAFGTGAHPTTALCLAWLDAHPPARLAVLDYGCGSGILSVASLVLGAESVTAVDIDEQALAATRSNARRNPGQARLTTLAPHELGASGSFDLLLANILSGTLIELAPTLRSLCHSGTNLVLSGILTRQAEDVADAFRPWCRMRAPAERDGWTLLTGTVAQN